MIKTISVFTLPAKVLTGRYVYLLVSDLGAIETHAIPSKQLAKVMYSSTNWDPEHPVLNMPFVLGTPTRLIDFEVVTDLQKLVLLSGAVAWASVFCSCFF